MNDKPRALEERDGVRPMIANVEPAGQSNSSSDDANVTALKRVIRTIFAIRRKPLDPRDSVAVGKRKLEMRQAFNSFLKAHPLMANQETFVSDMSTIRANGFNIEVENNEEGTHSNPRNKELRYMLEPEIEQWQGDNPFAVFMRATLQTKHYNLDDGIASIESLYAEWHEGQTLRIIKQRGGYATGKWKLLITDYFAANPHACDWRAIEIAKAVFEESGSTTGEPSDVARVVRKHPSFVGPMPTDGNAKRFPPTH